MCPFSWCCPVFFLVPSFLANRSSVWNLSRTLSRGPLSIAECGSGFRFFGGILQPWWVRVRLQRIRHLRSMIFGDRILCRPLFASGVTVRLLFRSFLKFIFMSTWIAKSFWPNKNRSTSHSFPVWTVDCWSSSFLRFWRFCQKFIQFSWRSAGIWRRSSDWTAGWGLRSWYDWVL